MQKEVDGKLEQVLQVLLAISEKGKALEEKVTAANALATRKEIEEAEAAAAAERLATSQQTAATLLAGDGTRSAAPHPASPPFLPSQLPTCSVPFGSAPFHRVGDTGAKKRLSDTTLAELLEDDGGSSTKWTCIEGDIEKDTTMACEGDI